MPNLPMIHIAEWKSYSRCCRRLVALANHARTIA